MKCLHKLAKETEDKAIDAYWNDDTDLGDKLMQQVKTYRFRIADGETIEVDF